MKHYQRYFNFLFYIFSGLINGFVETQQNENLNRCLLARTICDIKYVNQPVDRYSVQLSESYYIAKSMNDNKVVQKTLTVMGNDILVNTYECQIADKRITSTQFTSNFLISSSIENVYFVALRNRRGNNLILAKCVDLNEAKASHCRIL